MLRKPGRCGGIWRWGDVLFCAVVTRDLKVRESFRIDVRRRPGGLEDALAEAGRKLGRVPVVLSPWGEGVALRCVRGPKVSAQEAGTAATWEMEALLSGRNVRHVVRHAVLGFGPEHVDVLAAAVPEDVVRASVQPCRGRVRLQAVDLEACAAWRAARMAGAVPEERGPVAVVCPSASGVVVLVGRGSLEFVRLLPSEPGRELGRTLSYYETQQRAEVVYRYWVGPGVPDGFQPLELDGASGGEVIAAGLAAWPYLEPRLNLLTAEMREDARARVLLPWLLVGVLAAGAVGLGEAALYYRREASRALAQAAVLADAAARSEQLSRRTSELAAWEAVVRDFMGGLHQRSGIVDAVRRSVPRDVWLEKVDLVPGELREKPAQEPQLPPEGRVLVVEGRSFSIASVGVLRDALRQTLGCSAAVKHVVFDEKAGCYSFRLEAVLGGGGR